MDITHIGLGEFITKRDDNGDLIVLGKATGPDLDLDKQICDATWLKSAVTEWFETGANVREQHSSIAAGVGIEIEERGDDWWLKSLVVDPLTAKKVEKKVLKGYSIGIKDARVVKDSSAPGGRIIGGDIVEISLVDRPANPTARIEIAKSVNGVMTLTKAVDDTSVIVENPLGASEVEEPAKAVCPGCNGLGMVTDNPTVMDKTCEICGGTGEAPDELRADNDRFGNPVDNDNHDIKSVEPDDEDVVREGDQPGTVETLTVGEHKAVNTIGELKTLIQSIEKSSDAVVEFINARATALGRTDLAMDNTKAIEHDAATLLAVRAGLINLIIAELGEMLSGEEDETCDVSELLCTLQWFLCWWKREADEGETIAPFKMTEDENEGEDMAYIGLGVNADIAKAALAPNATDDARDALRAETIKALGVDKMFADTKTIVEGQEETIKSLKADLDEIRQMAAPGGPAVRQTAAQAQKSLTAEQMLGDAARLRRTAELLTDPTYKAEYVGKAASLEAEAERLFRN